MKKFNLLITLALVAGTIAVSTTIANAQNAQDNKATQQSEFVNNWYETCYDKDKKNADKCYVLSKELLEKYPNSNYRQHAEKNIKSYDQDKEKKAWENFQTALTAYYGPTQTAGNLEQLFTAGEEFYKFV